MDRYEVVELVLLIACTVAGIAVVNSIAHMLASILTWLFVVVQ